MKWTCLWRWASISVLAIATACICIILFVQRFLLTDVRDPLFMTDASSSPAIVLGASVKRDGTPSDILVDRVETAVKLYEQRQVGWILMSGDDGAFHVDEVSAMRALALRLGVPEYAVKTDGHGYRTYESCKRAHDVFGIDRAFIVTQRFHLSRAIYLCRSFGIDAIGISATTRTYQGDALFVLRDLLASIKAWWDINIVSPDSPIKAK